MKKNTIIGIILVLIGATIIGVIFLGKNKKINSDKILIKSSNEYSLYGEAGLMEYKEEGKIITEDGNIYEFEISDKEYGEQQSYSKKDLKKINNIFWKKATKCKKIGQISQDESEKLKAYLKDTINDYTKEQLVNEEKNNSNFRSISITDHSEGNSKELEFFKYDTNEIIKIICNSKEVNIKNNTSNLEEILKIVNDNLNTNYKK